MAVAKCTRTVGRRGTDLHNPAVNGADLWYTQTHMKAYFWLPFACLAGLVVGAWGPRAEIRAMKALAQEEKAKPRNAAAEGFKAFTSLANIPDEARRPRRRRPGEKDRVLFRGATNQVTQTAAPDSAAVSGTSAPTNAPAADGKRMPPKRLSPEDLRARIEEAQELWRTRVEVARTTWKDKLGVRADAGTQFDAALDEMNEHLYETMQTMARLVAKSDKVSPELGLRLVGDATAIMAETYEKVGACVPAEMRDTVSQMPMTDFIDPGVAEPLIAVQDKFEHLPEGFRRR